jgi:hypothetical protein
MITDFLYKKGRQPCVNFSAANEDHRWAGNVHECYNCQSTVSFCENCCKDHHENGYEHCKKLPEHKT